jgi:hypothetical protein
MPLIAQNPSPASTNGTTNGTLPQAQRHRTVETQSIVFGRSDGGGMEALERFSPALAHVQQKRAMRGRSRAHADAHLRRRRAICG